jgi:hypothetical protein
VALVCADHRLGFFFFRLSDAAGREAHDCGFWRFRHLQPASRRHDKQALGMQRRSGTPHTYSAQSRQSPSRMPPLGGPCPPHLPRMKSRALPFTDIQERGFRDLVGGTSIKGREQ